MSQDSTTPQTGEGPPDELAAELPGWTPRPSMTDPLDPDLTTVTDLPPALTQTPEWGIRHDDELDEERPEPTSPNPERTSRRSVGDPTVASAAAGLFGLFASIVSLVLNATIGNQSGAYLMQPAEAEAIGTPLGRIAARHAPIGDADVSDVGDGIQAGVATAAYAARATMEHFGGATPTPEPAQ